MTICACACREEEEARDRWNSSFLFYRWTEKILPVLLHLMNSLNIWYREDFFFILFSFFFPPVKFFCVLRFALWWSGEEESSFSSVFLSLIFFSLYRRLPFWIYICILLVKSKLLSTTWNFCILLDRWWRCWCIQREGAGGTADFGLQWWCRWIKNRGRVHAWRRQWWSSFQCSRLEAETSRFFVVSGFLSLYNSTPIYNESCCTHRCALFVEKLLEYFVFFSAHLCSDGYSVTWGGRLD